MNWKKIAGISLLFFAWALALSFQQPTQKSRLRKIIIDPGHGGHDGGAPGRYSNEKDIALAVSLRLEELLSKQMPEVEVFLTRKSDIYHSVVTKAQIANQAKGDLFISIHCNSVDPYRRKELVGYKTVKRKGKTRKVPEYRTVTIPNMAKGMETYIWGAHKNEDKLVAMRENQSMYLDSASMQVLKDFDPDSPEQMQRISLMTRNYFERSAFLALAIEEENRIRGGATRDALQRQKGIWVLQAVAMPAVLVETGYISNPEEEDYLNSADGQTEIAQVIVNALKRYKSKLDSKSIK